MARRRGRVAAATTRAHASRGSGPSWAESQGGRRRDPASHPFRLRVLHTIFSWRPTAAPNPPPSPLSRPAAASSPCDGVPPKILRIACARRGALGGRWEGVTPPPPSRFQRGWSTPLGGDGDCRPPAGKVVWRGGWVCCPGRRTAAAAVATGGDGGAAAASSTSRP